MIDIRNVQTQVEEDLVVDWYFEEWAIPKEETLQKLRGTPNQDIVVQRIVYLDGEPVATGGLYHRVGIQKRIPKYNVIGPWIGLMYTKPSFRGRGIGKSLLEDIEAQGFQAGFAEIFLFTHTADRLYRRCGWVDIEAIQNSEKTVFVMNKEFKRLAYQMESLE